jgi:alpha-ketoglutarate-dependent taurine dioxygenase
MKLTLHPNNWTITVTDFDFNIATDQEINTLGCLVNYYTLVVVKNQNLDVSVEEKICKRFGTTLDQDYGAECMKERLGRLLQPGAMAAQRVTGEKDEHGSPGLFGFNRELVWHADALTRKDRKSLIWLYGERGTSGSVTSFTNHCVAYHNMPDDFKSKIKNLKSVYSQPYSKDEQLFFKKTHSESDYDAPVVHTNESGQTGIFFSWLQFYRFTDMTVEDSKQIADQLRDFILDDPNHIYEHHWEDGDVLLAEQWLGVHKRHAFEHMDRRVLHRIETNFDKIDFSQLNNALSLIN